MSAVFIKGWGAVSPAGWDVAALKAAVNAGQPLPVAPLDCPAVVRPVAARLVPPPAPPPAFLLHPRLRRASGISKFAFAAAHQALGEKPSERDPARRMGIVLGVQAGAITYSERFFAEVQRDPGTASPLLFPETVFNAPVSHIAAWLGSAGPAFSLIGDKTVFLQALAMGAGWLATGRVEECLVVGAEELHWPIADAARLYDRSLVCSEGAGALLLSREAPTTRAIRLDRITDAHLHAGEISRLPAARRMRAEMPPDADDQLLLDGCSGADRSDRAEREVWRTWPGLRWSPRAVLGEALAAATAWQCVLGCDAIASRVAAAASVSVVGFNQCAMGASFAACSAGAFRAGWATRRGTQRDGHHRHA